MIDGKKSPPKPWENPRKTIGKYKKNMDFMGFIADLEFWTGKKMAYFMLSKPLSYRSDEVTPPLFSGHECSNIIRKLFFLGEIISRTILE